MVAKFSSEYLLTFNGLQSCNIPEDRTLHGVVQHRKLPGNIHTEAWESSA
jgi:hypothetical protein